jgi:hypothetical protein
VVVGAVSGFAGGKAVLRNDSTALGLTLIVFSAAIAFATMLCTVILLTIAVRILKRGRLLIHFFSEGIVLERTKGRVVAAVYERITADLLVFENSAHDGARPWDERMVILALSGGETAALFRSRDPAFATDLAAACGADAARRVELSEAIELEESQCWS